MKTNAKIYVMQAEDGTIKLGHSVDPDRRATQLGRHVEVVHATDVIEHVERIERLAHRVLALHGRHIRGEWFEATITDAILAIEIATRQAEQQELMLGGTLGNRLPQHLEPDKFFQMRVNGEFNQSLDRLRKKEDDLPTRAEMIRRLVDRALVQAALNEGKHRK
jgi:hypothetical protein